MISRRKAFVMGFIAVLLTFTLTFAGSTIIGLRHNDRIVITMSRYEQLVNFEKTYQKHENIKSLILRNFLFDVDEEQLLEGSLRGIVDVLGDPYSEYLSVEDLDSLMEQSRGEYSGIGIYVSVTEDNRIVVVAPIEDTPADKAGIRSGDFIIRVNGQEYSGDRLSDAVSIMRGRVGTDVTVTINRRLSDGTEKTFDLTITRENIRIATVKHELVEESLGYIRLTTFDRKTPGDFQLALQDLERQAMQGLIIDLRYNPGGLVSSVTEIADMLLGETIITYTETRDGQREYFKSDAQKFDLPVVILINGGSASASEILAGAMQDTESGILVGTQSFGKGIVQRIMPLDDGSGVKLTVSEYFTPNNTSIHGTGITPDFVIEMPEDANYGPDYLEEDVQLQKAIQLLLEN